LNVADDELKAAISCELTVVVWSIL